MKTEYICENCGYVASKWYGRCPQCSEWNTFVERENDEETPIKAKNKIRLLPALNIPMELLREALEIIKLSAAE